MVERLALLDATIPGLAPDIAVFSPEAQNDLLWYFACNRKRSVNEELVRGRRTHLFRRPVPPQGGATAAGLRDRLLRRDPGTRSRSASFDYYQATDDNIAQNNRRKRHPLTMPVLSVAGARGQRERLGALLRPVTKRLDSVVLPDSGHYVPEECPDALLDHIVPFLHH